MGKKDKIKQWTKNGIKHMIQKSGNPTLNHMLDLYREQKRRQYSDFFMVDVCFINGCDASVPHPPRYRVTHQREQLEANGLTTSEVFYTQFWAEDVVRYANAFVIFRCPYTDEIGKLIQLAKDSNKPVFFDIDDLVIDTCYTDLIPYVQGLTEEEKAVYDDGVIRMGKTLRLCDGAITTTKALADELKKYAPEVVINRNTASEEMVRCSKKAVQLRHLNETQDILLDDETKTIIKKRFQGEFRIGYFSGSITHNADVALILPVLADLLKKHDNIRLYLAGELDLPEELNPYKNQIVTVPFLDWHKLPSLISMVDVNLAPLEDTIFNRAKSENKWVEAALVDVVTVASNVGAFHEMISNGETGFLCDTAEEWGETLESLIQHPEERRKIAERAKQFVTEYCLTISSGYKISDFFRERTKQTAALILPSTEISGGIMVALRHVSMLFEKGYAITVIASNPSKKWMEYEDKNYPVIYLEREEVRASFALGIATMWTTVNFLLTHGKIRRKYYLVQNYETDFYEFGSPLRIQANSTYSLQTDIEYITISRWVQNWLVDTFHQSSRYVPNGIDLKNFPRHEREFSSDRKIRVLIEGDSAVAYKGVDESFKITNSLDHQKYEIWYMSYNAEPKSWYHVDKFLHRVPYEKVGQIYALCDILLKSSTLESFSYPPLEMMSTGGMVVAVQNGGNKEYLKDHENCLIYNTGDIEGALDAIHELENDKGLRDKLYQNGYLTAKPRDWMNLKESILQLYIPTSPSKGVNNSEP